MSSLNIPKTIKWVITDFDGIVTDNCVYIDPQGNMTRKLNFKDVMAYSHLRRNGFESAIISGEKNSAIEIIQEKFAVKEVHQDIRKKIDVLKGIIEKYGLNDDEYLYMGDDTNDIECLEFAKIKITVPNANKKVKEIKDIQMTENVGGDGAFREVVDCLIY